MNDSALDPETLRACVKVMRELHVVEYAGIKLAPLPAQADADATQQDEPDQETLEQRAHAERRRVALGASGSLRRLSGSVGDGQANKR